jgi:hypothetical protein
LGAGASGNGAGAAAWLCGFFLALPAPAGLAALGLRVFFFFGASEVSLIGIGKQGAVLWPVMGEEWAAVEKNLPYQSPTAAALKKSRKV